MKRTLIAFALFIVSLLLITILNKFCPSNVITLFLKLALIVVFLLSAKEILFKKENKDNTEDEWYKIPPCVLDVAAKAQGGFTWGIPRVPCDEYVFAWGLKSPGVNNTFLGRAKKRNLQICKQYV